MKNALLKVLAFLLVAALSPALPLEATAAAAYGDFTYTVTGVEVTITGYKGKGSTVTVPEAIAGQTVTAIGPAAFAGKSAITAITLPDSIATIESGAFQNCSGITAMILPDRITVINDNTFSGCSGLQHVELPEALLGIGQYAFAGCAALPDVEIPKWVNNLSTQAFAGCTLLGKVYFYGPPPAVSRGTFSGVASGFSFYYHLSQTGWVGYSSYPCKPFCHMTVEPMVGTEPTSAASGLNNGILMTLPLDPARDGYTFAGWYKEAACLHLWNFSTDIVTSDIMIYALWEPLSRTISFDSLGGSEVAPVSAHYGDLVIPPEAPVRAGYSFGGWYKDTGCTAQWDFFREAAQGDTVLYAAWMIPAKPTDVRAASAGYQSINIRWKAAPNASGYEIWRSATASGGYTLAGTVTGLSYTSTDLATNTPYYYKVRSIRQTDMDMVYSLYSPVVSSRPLPSAPRGVKAAVGSTGGIEITWRAVDGASQYEIWRYDASTKKYALLSTTASRHHADSNVAAGVDYVYKIRACAIVGKKRVYGPYSAAAGAKP